MNFDVNRIKYINEINIQQKLQAMKNNNRKTGKVDS